MSPQVEISLQPWEAFKPDGVILFSDILTPLSGMNIPFDIVQGKGPIIADPIRSMEVSAACSEGLGSLQDAALQLRTWCITLHGERDHSRVKEPERLLAALAPRSTCKVASPSSFAPCKTSLNLSHTLQQVEKVTPLDSDAACPFVGEALRTLRSEVGSASTVLGFVGAPFTLASYIVEGGSSKNFAHVKKMAFSNPEVLHALNAKLAKSVADYVRYQAR